ncbi:MAG TPA: hypothetical protein VMV12_00785 [Candidatus Micrarchaeaceae archaeon]|nr:hypothetical protein [Candidatus Micrarchaeaceae archaeon]
MRALSAGVGGHDDHRRLGRRSLPFHEARHLARTLLGGRQEIAVGPGARVSNGRTEAVDDVREQVKRAVFGFTLLRKSRIHSLLQDGKPNCDRLATVTPR